MGDIYDAFEECGFYEPVTYYWEELVKGTVVWFNRKRYLVNSISPNRALYWLYTSPSAPLVSAPRELLEGENEGVLTTIRYTLPHAPTFYTKLRNRRNLRLRP